MRDLKERLAVAPDEGVMDENGRTRHGRLSVQSVVQSGSFSMLNGSLYVGNEIEPSYRPTVSPKSIDKNPQSLPAPGVPSGNTSNRLRNHRLSLFSMPDIVQPDDVIDQGSLCVGLDCVNGEVFSFDTIRLKENNTRISFNDTSTTAGFPTNDWTIRANSSASGGASFLAFVDRGTSESGDETGTIVFEVDDWRHARSSTRTNQCERLHRANLGHRRQRSQLLRPRRDRGFSFAVSHSARRANQLDRHQRQRQCGRRDSQSGG